MKKYKITLKKKSWDDVSINEYYEIQDILAGEGEWFDKEVEVLAILCDCTPDDIYNLTMAEVNDLTGKIGWISDFKYPQKWSIKKLNIAGQPYKVVLDLQEMSVSQYIDFQAFYSKNDLKQYIGNILAVFLIPKGKDYCDGYNASELATSFRDTVPITVACSLFFSFARRLRISIKATLIYYQIMLKKLQKMLRKEKTPNPQILEKMKEAQAEIRRMNQLFQTVRFSTDG